MDRFWRRARSERGAVAVEFAIIFPVLMLILFGVIQFGKVYSQWQVFQGAAREGARCAAVQSAEAAAGLPVCNVVERITDASGAYTPDLANYSAGVCTEDNVGANVTVGWDQAFDLNVPFWSQVTITGRMEGTFRCE
jgi:Flp pilus assembly protein TadG